MPLAALIFDVDGTLAETEEAHRQAFNSAFVVEKAHDRWPDHQFAWVWSEALYRDLLKTTGGKERIAAYLRDHLRVDPSLWTSHIESIHRVKTKIYTELVANGALSLRPGIRELIEEAHRTGIVTAIATTTSRANVDSLVLSCFGRDAAEIFPVICAGDEVARKKPAPDVYARALELLSLPASACVALEDSWNGLISARSAGLACIVSPGRYTQADDLSRASLVVRDFSALSLRDVGALLMDEQG
jgi:HAD superfamily hydrolase (TIGR01509 family)